MVMEKTFIVVLIKNTDTGKLDEQMGGSYFNLKNVIRNINGL